ncbi:MAG: hypothetical protein AAB612_03735 [Patescibacteria group bacterium]
MRILFFAVVFLFAIWLELTFGLGGLFFAVSVLAFSWNSSENWILAVCFFISAGVADLVFGRVFGQTALVIGIALMFWRGIQNLSRWRLFAYMVFGTASTFFLSLSSSWQPSWPKTFIALIGMWIIVRTLHLQRGSRELHVL